MLARVLWQNACYTKIIDHKKCDLHKGHPPTNNTQEKEIIEWKRVVCIRNNCCDTIQYCFGIFCITKYPSNFLSHGFSPNEW